MSEVEERKETRNTKRREDKNWKIEHKGNCKEVLASEVLGQPPQFVLEQIATRDYEVLSCNVILGKRGSRSFQRKETE